MSSSARAKSINILFKIIHWNSLRRLVTATTHHSLNFVFEIVFPNSSAYKPRRTLKIEKCRMRGGSGYQMLQPSWCCHKPSYVVQSCSFPIRLIGARWLVYAKIIPSTPNQRARLTWCARSQTKPQNYGTQNRWDEFDEIEILLESITMCFTCCARVCFLSAPNFRQNLNIYSLHACIYIYK